LVPLATSLPALLAVLAMIVFGNGINTPSTSALISRNAPAERQGEVLGIAQSMSSLGRILGPWFGGFVFGHISRHAPYIAGGAVLAIASALVASNVRQLEGPARVEVHVGSGE